MNTLLRSSIFRIRTGSSASVSRTRSFYTPFVSNSRVTNHSANNSPASSNLYYTKDFDASPADFSSGVRTYTVSPPDPNSKAYEVSYGAEGAFPNIAGEGQSSTSSNPEAHPLTRAVAQHPGGVGSSSAVRHREAPGEMGKIGGSDGGIGLMDKEGTVEGAGELAARNPPPDGEAAERFSKLGVDEAWKVRK